MAMWITIIILIFLLYFFAKAVQRADNNNRFATRYVALSDVDYMDGHDFEYFCADLLKYDGFSHISVTKGSNDQGVDIIAYKDGQKYAIQCKRYNSTLGNKPVQEVDTGRAIYGCSQAIVLTNNFFTKGAVEASSATGVLLWDRRKLDALIRAKQLGIGKNKRLSFTTNGEPNKKIIFLSIGIVFFFAIIFSIISVVGNPESGKTGKENNEAVTVEVYSAVTAGTNLEMGESVVLNDISITITKLMFARHTGNLKYLDMVDGELINCCIYANLENTGDNPVDLTGYDAVLICDGVEYEQMLIDNPEFLFFHQIIEPDKTLSGKVIDFQIPNGQQNSDSQIYLIVISPDGQRVKWQLR